VDGDKLDGWQLCMITFANVGVYLVPAGYIRDYRTAGSLVIMRPGDLKSMSANAVADLGSSAESGIRSKIRIVVADDHPIFRDGLCKLLGVEEDLEVVAQAENGLEVLGVLQRFEPDILLLDLRMPGLDGLATLERLEMAPTKTRVIVLTASDDQHDFIETLKRGTSGIVPKQASMETLISGIRHVHAGEMWLDPQTKAAVIHQFVAPVDESEPGESTCRNGSQLSSREREIVALVTQGFKNQDIAEKLSIAEQTVKNYLHNIFDKLHATDRLELALYAISGGIHL